MRVAVTSEFVYGACGVSVINDFIGIDNDHQWYTSIEHMDLTQDAGIGYTMAGFIDNDQCQYVYEHIKLNYKIVFQSPVKLNRNSQHKFFFIIFTNKD